LKITTEKVLKAVGRCLKQLERSALQLDKPSEPLSGRLAAAQPTFEMRAGFDCRYDIVAPSRHLKTPFSPSYTIRRTVVHDSSPLDDAAFNLYRDLLELMGQTDPSLEPGAPGL
jgi:hypothetical protein